MQNDHKMSRRCRLCFSTDLRIALRLKQSPSNISCLLRPNNLDLDDSIELDVYLCDQCGFVQIDQVIPQDFYDEYLMTSSHSYQMRAFQQIQAEGFVKKFGLIGKRLVEIGPGDGNYLEYLSQAGAKVVGIEPSTRFRKLAEDRGFSVFAGYVRQDQMIPGAPYEAFVARQVLEHVPDIHDFLQGIRRSTVVQAYGLIEVPSLEQAMEKNRFYDFFADHLNYFSARTLRFALELNGFEVLDVMRGMNGEYNVALVRSTPYADFTTLQKTVDLLSDDLQQFIADNRKAGKSVAVWGAGGKGLAVMAIARVQDISYVIDSDPEKQGLYTPVSHLPIVPPQRLITEPVDAVIITALAFKNEILSLLKEQLNFEGLIAILGPRLEVLNNTISSCHEAF